MVFSRYLFSQKALSLMFDRVLNKHTAKNSVISPNSWCRNFAERHSFRIVSSDLPETMRKLCFSTKFPHQEIR